MYCAPDLSGFYWCTQTGSFLFQCPTGTVCKCFDGPACDQSQGSPCDFPPVLPTYPTEFTATRSIIENWFFPVETSQTNTSQRIYYSFSHGAQRIDNSSVTIVSIDTQQQTSSAQASEYTIRLSSTQIAVFSYSNGQCTGQVLDAAFPIWGVPNGYQQGNSSSQGTYWIYKFGGRIPGHGFSINAWILTSSSTPTIPIRENFYSISISMEAVADSRSIAWNSFHSGTPNSSVFALPPSCQALGLVP